MHEFIPEVGSAGMCVCVGGGGGVDVVFGGWGVGRMVFVILWKWNF